MITRTVIIVVALLTLGCKGKAGKDAGTQAPPGPADSVAVTETQAPALATIISVHAQWIISDSKRKGEITLTGQNLAARPTVTSDSPQIVVESVDPDPGRTLVIVVVDSELAAGEYTFKYQAPGQPAIPFTLRYAAPR